MTSDVESKERKLLFEREEERKVQETFDPSTWSTYACVSEPNTRFQIYEDRDNPKNAPMRVGELVIERDYREGDKWVAFENGLFFTNDDECKRFCDSKYPMIVDMADPNAQTLVALARLQTPRADYEPELVSKDLIATVGADLLAAKQRVQDQIKAAVEAAKAQWEAEQNQSRIQRFDGPVSSVGPVVASQQTGEDTAKNDTPQWPTE